MENTNKADKGSSLPLLIVDDGKPIKENVELIKSNNVKIEEFIKRQGGSLKKTEVLTIDGDGRAYLKQKNKKFQVLRFELFEGVKW
jgi:hypothetical protein